MADLTEKVRWADRRTIDAARPHQGFVADLAAMRQAEDRLEMAGNDDIAKMSGVNSLLVSVDQIVDVIEAECFASINVDGGIQ